MTANQFIAELVAMMDQHRNAPIVFHGQGADDTVTPEIYFEPDLQFHVRCYPYGPIPF